MVDFIRKTYLAGLGLASLTGDRIEEIVEDLVKKGEVAEKDRKKMIDELITKGKEQREQLSATIKENVNKVVHELNIPRRDQYDELLKRVENLEKKAAPAKKTARPKNAPPAKK